MPKFPQPWNRKGRGWYVTLHGKQIPLGKDWETAEDIYLELRKKRPKKSVPNNAFAVLADHFIAWLSKNRSDATCEWYRSRLQLFVDRVKSLRVRDMEHFHLQEWIDSLEVSSGTKRNFCRAVIRCLNWGEKQGRIDHSPLKGFELPEAGVRETVITPAQFAEIMELVKGEQFRDLLLFAWESGARAQECLAAEARHYERDKSRLVFPVSEAKGKKKLRIIHLSDKANEIVKRLVSRYPAGRLFRNHEGKPWTTDAVNCAFSALQVRMGIRVMKADGLTIPEQEISSLKKTLRPAFKNGVPKTERDLKEEAVRKLRNRLAVALAPKYCLTVFRHSYCHRLLRAGVDALTVANLMGHSGISMVAKVYSHLSQAQDYLRDALRKAVG